jgi:FkbM family methyltransferase
MRSQKTFIRRAGKALAYYLKHPLSALERDQVVTTVDGIRMVCLRENLIERVIADTGVWEPAETVAVKRCIRPGHVCIDVGANIGYFSLLMAKLGATVHAFEPTTYGFERLSGNLALNTNLRTSIVAHRKGLSDRACEITEALEARFSLRMLAHDHLERMQFETLDADWTAKRIDFLKIDVDGHDTEVVRGARESLRRHRPTVMAEFCDRVLKQYGSSVHELALAFLDCGYDECEVLNTNERTTLKKFTTEPRSIEGSWNLLLK